MFCQRASEVIYVPVTKQIWMLGNLFHRWIPQEDLRVMRAGRG